MLIYVDGGNAAFALGAGAEPGNMEYECEARQGEQIQIGGRASGVAYGRSTSGGRATIRVQADVNGAVRKIPWSDSRVLDGGKALTIQRFVEAHIKEGRQYAGAFYEPELAAQATADIILQVGPSASMQLRAINIQFDGAIVSTQWFREPTFTGGSPIDLFNYNDAAAVEADLSVLGGATVTDPGTAMSPRIYSIGTATQGNRVTTSESDDPDIDRILEPDTTYLFRVTNEDTNQPCRVAGSATWYQGPLSTELP